MSFSCIVRKYKSIKHCFELTYERIIIMKKLHLHLVFTGIIGIILAAFMVYCFQNHVTIVGPYTTETLLIPLSEPSVVSNVFSVLCITATLACMIIPVIFMRKHEISEYSENSIFLVFSTSLLGFLFAGYALNFAITPLKNMWFGPESATSVVDGADTLVKIIYYAGVVFAVPCAVYFLLLAMQERFKPSAKLCLLSVTPVIWLALRLVYYFMTTSAFVNISGRNLCIISMCLTLFFFLQDSKRWFAKDSANTPSKNSMKYNVLYYASGFGAILTSTVYFLAITYLEAFWILSPQDSYLINAIFISMVLFIAFRIASTVENSSSEIE